MRVLSVLIYKIDSSKLVKIGEPGHQDGQEQAKVYFDEMPKDEFTVAITGEEMIEIFGARANVDLSGNNRILVGVDNRDSQHICMDIVYFDNQRGSATSRLISHANIPQDSDYILASKLLGFIEEAFYAQKGKPLADVIADATQRSVQQGDEKEVPEMRETKSM